ncbi:MAG: hypothetical protein ABW217_14235, partial [Polyangiaceae bacterium]
AGSRGERSSGAVLLSACRRPRSQAQLVELRLGHLECAAIGQDAGNSVFDSAIGRKLLPAVLIEVELVGGSRW